MTIRQRRPVPESRPDARMIVDGVDRRAHRGYLVRRSVLTGDWWVEHDGVTVYRSPVNESDARNAIDLLVSGAN